jgi:8-hydroxy-5-deazaflavin:NADPH oxidoreductase
VNVAVIGGTGEEGFGLALRWAAAGIDVVIGSRDAGRAESAAARLAERVESASARGLENPQAAEACDVVVVTVPFAGQATIYKSIAPHIRPEAVVVDCTVPLAAAVGGRAAHTLGVWQGSAAQQGAALLEKGRGTQCAAFHTLSATALEALDQPLDSDVLVCGGRKGKEVVKKLVEAIPGLRYVDAGPLENARLVEPLTALLIGINRRYGIKGAGIRVTGLPE